MDKYDAINILEEIQIVDDGLGQYINGFDEAIDMGIKAIQNEISFVDELEKIKTDIKDVSKTLAFINHTTMVCDEDTKLFVSMEDVEKMFTKHINKLKGENNE